ncbi:M15 family metallopeptidase [Bacillus sp. ISL-4]|uniref:M15 family metallopeptidase n=1 Tax=Bacillus sp. ISL-4 TaxID=2819125 RepID=UPI001BECBFBC|nr:M15 family metallopeptidase [Bacillus sp. ISL-4]MBT2666758.1 M15 family metallopeptidase [Bacillus sp. ISL-4]MBT2672397.1 M15 family metallopeptidase [Streptomyces sp. ISL-14]
MNSVVKASTLEMIKHAYKEGIYAHISSGYRSMEEQGALFGQGRIYSYKGKNYSNLFKPKVTNALPGLSFHNFGVAIDYFLVSDDGKTVLRAIKTKCKRETCSLPMVKNFDLNGVEIGQALKIIHTWE